jgi:hypothetical protein
MLIGSTTVTANGATRFKAKRPWPAWPAKIVRDQEIFMPDLAISAWCSQEMSVVTDKIELEVDKDHLSGRVVVS